MSKIDEILRSSPAPEPRRDLATDFSQKTLAGLTKAGIEPSKKSVIFGLKPAQAFIVSLIVVCTLSVGVYGLAKNLGFLNIIFNSETVLPSGDRVIGVDTKNCAKFWQNSQGESNSSDQRLYFRLSKDSTLSTEQFVQAVQGQCEIVQDTREPSYSEIIDMVYDRLPHDLTTVVVGYDSVARVTSLTPSSITVTYIDYITPALLQRSAPKVVTYSVEDHQITKLDVAGHNIDWSQIKPGDFIMPIVSADSKSGGEYTPLEGKADNKLLLVQQKSDNVAAYLRLSLSGYETDLERVVPCHSDPSKYCTIHDVSNPFDNSANPRNN